MVRLFRKVSSHRENTDSTQTNTFNENDLISLLRKIELIPNRASPSKELNRLESSLRYIHFFTLPKQPKVNSMLFLKAIFLVNSFLTLGTVIAGTLP